MINFGFLLMLLNWLFCSGGKTEQNYCSKFHKCGNYQTCPKVPNFSKNHQTECYGDPNPSKYTCINRMDKYNESDEIFTKSLYSEEPLKLNKDFNFTSSGIPCKDDKVIPWTREGLDDLMGRTCHSKNGRKLSGNTLHTLLLRDIGFRGRKHIPEDELKV